MANGNAGLMILAIGGLVGYAAYKAGQRRPEATEPSALPPAAPTSDVVPVGVSIDELDPRMLDIFTRMQTCKIDFGEGQDLIEYTTSLVPETQAEADWINGVLAEMWTKLPQCFPTMSPTAGMPLPRVSVRGVHVGDCGCEECKAKVGNDEPCCDACARGVGACACQQVEDDRLINSGGA